MFQPALTPPPTKEGAILEKARELMFRYGVKSLTMDDIATHMGISKKTLYQVVSNKSDLVSRVVSHTLHMRCDVMNKLSEVDQNAIDHLASIYRTNFAFSGMVHTSLNFDLKKYYPESWEMIDSFKKKFIRASVENNLRNGISQGIYRAELNVEVIAYIYTSHLINTDTDAESQEYTQAEIMRENFYYHIRGIASPKGLEYLEAMPPLGI